MSKLKTGLFIAFALLFACPFLAKAAVCDENTVVKVTARDPNGSYIAGASVDLYTQTVDADGNKKPGTRLAGGTTDATLGVATLTFKNSAVTSASYVLRIRTISKDEAGFWFFDNTFACGETVSVSKTLGGFHIALHEADGDVLTNTSFSLYTQLYDANGNLTNNKDELMSSYNSGTSGQVKVYLPQGSVRGLAGSGAVDNYVLEVSHGGVKSYIYGLVASDGSMTSVNYYLSILRVRLKYSSGSSAVGSTVEVYKQEVDLNDEYKLGSKIGSFTIADNGYGSMEISPGTYALRVKVGSEYQYFWDNNVADGQTSEFLLTLSGSSSFSSTACAETSKVNITLRNMAGVAVPGLKFEIYEQAADSSGLPIPGTKVAGGTVDSYGRATVSLKPDSGKNYILKVWDKKADLGEFWFFNAVKFVCGYDRNLTKNLPALKIVLRDSQGTPKYNYSFSLYAQHYDIDGNPAFSSSDLIANLKTGSDGQAVVYVSPYNVYRGGQTGFYAISTKDGNGNTKNFYNISIPEDKDYSYQPAFSGLNGILQDAQGRLLKNKSLALYEQNKASGYYVLGQKLLSFKTDGSGQFEFEYPDGTYAISAPDDINRSNIFWNTVIGSAKSYKKLTASLINFNFSDSSSKSAATLQLYALDGRGGTYTKGDLANNIKLTNGHASLSLAAGPYLVSYSGANDRVFGKAFYAKNGVVYNLNFSAIAKYDITGKTSFSLVGADQNLVVSSPSTCASCVAASSGSVSARVKGRILLQVEDKGQAWYVSPVDGLRYSLGRPADAFKVMRQLALGVSNSDFAAIEKNPSAWKSLAGRILLKVKDNGQAYYFDPVDWQLYYLGRPADAFSVMRSRGLGITDSDLSKVWIGD